MTPPYPNTCPKCGADPGDPCRTLTTGRVTDTHAARLGPSPWLNWHDHNRPPRDGFIRLGPDMYAAWFTDSAGNPGTHPILWHWCVPTSDAAAQVCRKGTAPHWCPWGTKAHTVVSRDPLTLSPSVYWPGCCGMHGFVEGGVYRGV